MKDSITRIAEDLGKVVVVAGTGFSSKRVREVQQYDLDFPSKRINLTQFMASEDTRRVYWHRIQTAHHAIQKHVMTPAYTAIKCLADNQAIHGIITTHTDGCFQKTGISENVILELAGNIHHVRCLKCGARKPFDEIACLFAAESVVPTCPCGGYLASDVLFAGELIEKERIQHAFRQCQTSRTLMLIGCHRLVYPISLMPAHANRAAQKTIIVMIDSGSSSYDQACDVLLHQHADDVLPAVVCRRQELVDTVVEILEETPKHLDKFLDTGMRCQHAK